MLVVQCVNGNLAWLFVWVTGIRKAARCMNDGFTYEYDPSPSLEWATVVQTIIAHSVQSKGAFQNTHWVELA